MSRRNLKSILLVALTLPTGCALLEPASVPTGTSDRPAAGPATTSEPGPDAGTRAEIDRLLTGAELAFEDNRLTTPVDDNAYLRYLRVLSLSPGNEAAERGIAAIVEKYLTWALEHAEAGNLSVATRYLGRATSVDDRHPGIESIARRIEELRRTSRERHPLDPGAVDERAPALVDELRRIARLAESRDALVVISARTDAEGRWIYQTMNESTSGRIRARLELSARPVVRMVYKDRND